MRIAQSARIIGTQTIGRDLFSDNNNYIRAGKPPNTHRIMSWYLYRRTFALSFFVLISLTVYAQDSSRVLLRSFLFSDEEKRVHEELLHTDKELAIETIRRKGLRTTTVDYSSYSVGEIPLQEGVSPSGARTYQIPIPTAGGYKFVPSLSLGYNSQGSDGWAGYGWDIQGMEFGPVYGLAGHSLRPVQLHIASLMVLIR